MGWKVVSHMPIVIQMQTRETPSHDEQRYTVDGTPIDRRRGPGVVGFGPGGVATVSASLQELAAARRSPEVFAARRARARASSS